MSRRLQLQRFMQNKRLRPRVFDHEQVNKQHLRRHLQTNLKRNELLIIVTYSPHQCGIFLIQASEPRGQPGHWPRNAETAGAKVSFAPAIIFKVY